MVPYIEIDGRPATADDIRLPATVHYGHFTAMQVRDGRVRGLALHLARLDAGNRELFRAGLDGDLVRDRIRHALGTVADASVRVSVLWAGADDATAVMVTVRPPGEPPCLDGDPGPDGDRWVSYILIATTAPDSAVSAATTQIAAAIPNRSASTPETSAPSANPRSRHRR